MALRSCTLVIAAAMLLAANVRALPHGTARMTA
jgi:hypothetical protein